METSPFFDLVELQHMKAVVLHAKWQLQNKKSNLKILQQVPEFARAPDAKNAKLNPFLTGMRQMLHDADKELETLLQGVDENAWQKMNLEVRIETL